MNVIYVTALKNINRDLWTHFKRPLQEYYNGLTDLLNICPNCVAFLDDDAFKYASSLELPNKNQYKLFPYDEDNTFLGKYLETEQKIMSSDNYNSLIQHRRHHPEHFCPEYNLVNHNKAIFLKKAAEMFPNYDYYVWIDVHYTRFNDNNNRMPTSIHHLPIDKISICSFLQNNEIPHMNAKEVAITAHEIFQGSMFVVPKHKIEDFYNAYIYELESSYQQNVADDDQAIHQLLYTRLPSLYHIVHNSKWGTCIQKILIQNA